MTKTQGSKGKRETYTITIPKRQRLSDAEKSPDVRFIRTIGKRVTKVLKLLKGIRNGSNMLAYSYTDKQVASMFKAIDKALERAKAAYASPSVNGAARKPASKVESFFTS